MGETIKVSGYENLKTALRSADNSKQVNIYFTGSKTEHGISWCPDCVSAEPCVFDAVDRFAEKDSIFIIVEVGDRSFWKDMKNPFRTDKEIFISVIPTLIRWKGAQRLEGSQLEKIELLEMFFTD